jgi:hypothetical protein
MKFVYENVCVCVFNIHLSGRNPFSYRHLFKKYSNTLSCPAYTHTSYSVYSIRMYLCVCVRERESLCVCAWDPRLYCHLCLFIYRCMQTHFSHSLEVHSSRHSLISHSKMDRRVGPRESVERARKNSRRIKALYD